MRLNIYKEWHNQFTFKYIFTPAAGKRSTLLFYFVATDTLGGLIYIPIGQSLRYLWKCLIKFFYRNVLEALFMFIASSPYQSQHFPNGSSLFPTLFWELIAHCGGFTPR